MKINSIEFPGSYIISSYEKTGSLEDYIAHKINNYNIYLSNKVIYDALDLEYGQIFLIGYCFDIRNGDITQQEILKSLLNSEDLLEELDYINGRYIILISKNDQLEIYTDASQLQPLVYNTSEKVLASHDQLLAMYLNEQNIPIKQREDLENHSELDFTRYYNVYKYNPSLKLDIVTFEFQRIYPRKTLKTRATEDVFKEIMPYFNESIKWLKKNKQRKFLTITAGIDSRVSASLTRSLEDVEYLTYITPQSKLASRMAKNIYRTDNFITQSMKDNLRWNHDIINIFNYRPVEEKYQKMFEILNSRHSLGLRKYYEEEKRYNHALHIKSTVFGMGKADFKNDLDHHEETFEFYNKCVHGLPKNLESDPSYNRIIKNYYERNLIEEGVGRGRHFFDLFHLESRMGNWHSTLTLETDPQTDEFIFTNTRKIIDLIQQPSLSERRNYSLYKKIINDSWPVLLHFGINKKENYYEQSVKNNISIRDFKIEVNDLFSTELKGNLLFVKPKKAPINFQDTFEMKIRKTETTGKIRLRSTYSNPKGSGLIKVIVRNDNNHDVYDIIKLNEGLEIPINNDGATIILFYNRTYTNKSWRDAGELIIET